jgi:hypothetical protein
LTLALGLAPTGLTAHADRDGDIKAALAVEKSASRSPSRR